MSFHHFNQRVFQQNRPQSDILAIAQMDCKAFAHQNLDAVIFRALRRPLSIVFRNIVGNEVKSRSLRQTLAILALN